MTDDQDDGPADKGSRDRPSQSGRFQKGQSGNPRGRPRKQRPVKEWIAAQFPTREALRAEAARRIAINDASGRQEVTTTEAVIRALALNAARGGVLAQRTYLEVMRAEDERLHRERSQRYDFWDAYQQRERAAIAAARKAGRTEPDPLPHPDDIELDPVRLEVRFLGAVDEVGRIAEKQALAFQRLGFEMSAYLGEDNCLPPGKGQEGRIGFYMAMYLAGRYSLPPRLQLSPEALEADIKPTMWLGMKAWGDDLERRCREGSVPFIRWRPGIRLPTRPMSKIGVRWTPEMMHCSC